MRGEKQMNRKEKKAVGLLKALNNLEKKCKIEKVPYKSEIKKIRISLLPEDYGIFEILLNLIEKLQKENEELKIKNNAIKRESEAYAENMIRLDNELNLEKEKSKYKWIRQNCLPQELVNKLYIPIQKVKDKIKELEEELEIMKIDNMYGRYKEYGGKTKWERLFATKYGMHDALQELLEGRK